VLEFLRQTGVGSLPLLPLPVPDAPPSVPPTEQELLAQTNAAIEHDYERQRRVQESAGVVASLLAVNERR
jgi:hypothetical protein